MREGLNETETVACCSPLSAEPLTTEQAEQVAPLLKALADPVRLRMMSLVASHPGGKCAHATWASRSISPSRPSATT